MLRAASNSSPSLSPSSILSCASAKGLKIPGFQTGVSSLQQTLKLQCSGCRRAAGDPEELQLREQLPGPWPVLDPLGSACFSLQGAQSQRLSHSAGWRCPAGGNSLSTQAVCVGGGGRCLTGVMTWMHLSVYEINFKKSSCQLKKGIICLSLAADSSCSQNCPGWVALGTLQSDTAPLFGETEGQTCIEQALQQDLVVLGAGLLTLVPPTCPCTAPSVPFQVP